MNLSILVLIGVRDVFLSSLKKLGVQPSVVLSYQSTDKDFTAQLSRIREANPDGVAIFGTIPAAPAIMNQARDLGINFGDTMPGELLRA